MNRRRFLHGWHHSVKRSMLNKWHLPHLNKQLHRRLHADVGGRPRLSSFNDGSWQSKINQA